MNQPQTDLAVIRTRLQAAMTTLPYKVGVLMVAWSKDRFKYANWIDTYPEAWQGRSKKPQWANKGRVTNNAGRALLTQSGRLRRSIRIVGTTANSVTIGSDVPYAGIHNNGGRMNFTQTVRQHVRRNPRGDQMGVVSAKAGKKSTRIRIGVTAEGISVVRSHQRKMDYTMPQRRFMGPSKYLNMQISRLVGAEINKVFK